MGFESADETPAARAIRLLGLIDLAHACRVTTDAVRKWPKSKGGVVPAQHQTSVLGLAQKKNIALSAADLIAEPKHHAGEAA